MVADARSRRSHAELAAMMCREWQMLGDLAGLDVEAEGTDSDEIGRASCRERVCQYV